MLADVVRHDGVEQIADVTFTVSGEDLAKAVPIVEQVAKEIKALEVVADDGLGKVSIVGTGMQSAPGYAARMFRALCDAEVNIDMISTGEIRITCIIGRADVEKAVRALHTAFELEKAEPGEL